LGLGYPGGPIIEQLAKEGDPNRFTFPVPLKGKPGCDLSFSGLKTAFRLLIQKNSPLSEQDIKDIAACLQNSIAESLASRAKNALLISSRKIKDGKTLVLTGGVGANLMIRNKLKALCDSLGFTLVTIPLELCTDNAAMIAWTGLCYHLHGISHPLNFETNPRWKIDAGDLSSQKTK
jgi:N6-L-threonylcarbamoyladenine synthase